MTIFKTLIDADALHALIEAGAVSLFDCDFDLADPLAGSNAYRSGHIPGAQYMDLDRDLSAPAGPRGRHPLPDPEAFAATMRAAGLVQGRQVVAYDAAGGPYAARLWWLLRWLGHEAVAVLDGGKQAWVAAGHPLETSVRPVPAGDFAARPGSLGVVDAEAVLANIASGERLVLDARAPERFAGQPNPLDPVAGHIPGARNRFFKANLREDGRFQAAEALRKAFAELIGERSPEAVILQCGSGVTACHNALAMEIAGLGGASLYPGSWSEWIVDPRRPVETDRR
ncbi:sulfurtransferase [Flavisphingomonas formosensis]|uniref:sulfurtransferase n=1 Tax=Flavisphingomonas formosensis TaxID=861534 RepID=UPI0012F8BC0D|nr:sulfurtransferase [Sphingomonas formosensis]